MERMELVELFEKAEELLFEPDGNEEDDVCFEKRLSQMLIEMQ
jgi:hypothetical protein